MSEKKKIQIPKIVDKIRFIPVQPNGPEVQKIVDSGDRMALIDYNIRRMAPLLDALRKYDSEDETDVNSKRVPTDQ